MSKLILSAYGSHNAAISMFVDGEYTIVEVERWLNSKNAGLTFYAPVSNPQLVFDEICDYLLAKAGRTKVDVFITGYLGDITPKFEIGETLACDHHVAHAACAFYQSPYTDSLVFTFDGGGDGGFFNVYHANRTAGIKLLAKFDQDLGFPYMVLADYLADIKKESLPIGNLVYAGKLMGLCSYGKVRKDWLPYFDAFYDKFNYSGDSFKGGAEVRYEALTTLFHSIGEANFDLENSSYSGQFAWDIAATTQRAFENQFFKYAKRYLDTHSTMPVTLAGGCALNVLLNTKLLQQRKGKVFVPPNTNDCGISVGGILWYNAPTTQVDLTYAGLPIMDANRFAEYMESGKFTVVPNKTVTDIARFIADGFILGVIQGNSEHGSRALGNRSIICNPIAGMKDTLNKKVKNREWYRPFAPIAREDDVQRYFDFHGTESRHMVFVAEVRDEWKSVLPAITHEDGTGRLQTVKREQNELIYDVITEFANMTGHGVILNTSFNVNGKPILTRLSDALDILENSKLDAVYYKGNFIYRCNDIKEKKEPEEALSEDTTIYANLFDTKLNLNDIGKYELALSQLASIPKTNLVVVADIANSGEILKHTSIPVKYKMHWVGNHRHYYGDVIKKVFPALTSTLHLSSLIKTLWNKEVIRENPCKTKYHAIVDLVGDTLKTENIASFIRDIGKTEGQGSLVSVSTDITIHSPYFLSTTRNRPSVLGYTSRLIGGTYADLDWLLTNYEGYLNHYLLMGQSVTESDILTLLSRKEPQHFRAFYHG